MGFRVTSRVSSFVENDHYDIVKELCTSLEGDNKWITVAIVNVVCREYAIIIVEVDFLTSIK